MKFTLTLCITLIFSVLNSYCQELSPERKYYNLQQAEKNIFFLPYEMDHIKDVIYPEIISERNSKAPHYPDISTLPRTEGSRKAAFLSWIDMYESEYNDYYTYLATYIRQHQNK